MGHSVHPWTEWQPWVYRYKFICHCSFAINSYLLSFEQSASRVVLPTSVISQITSNVQTVSPLNRRHLRLTQLTQLTPLTAMSEPSDSLIDYWPDRTTLKNSHTHKDAKLYASLPDAGAATSVAELAMTRRFCP